jgi:hypothetical protein
MVNYKIVNDKQFVDIGAGYVEIAGDILETKTNQIVKEGLGMRQAKEMVRHLNFGGGFDGWTPAFFLTKSEKYLSAAGVFV